MEFEGIRPDLLFSQILSTAPFYFEPGFAPQTFGGVEARAYLDCLQKYHNRTEAHSEGDGWSRAHYFRFCLSAHWATVGTFVPTDVDNTIRVKLWKAKPEEREAMAQVVLEAYGWDELGEGPPGSCGDFQRDHFWGLATRRWALAPQAVWQELGARGRPIFSGHQGEWFTVAVPAYYYNKSNAPQVAERLLHMIEDEAHRQADIFLACLLADDGLSALVAAAMIAHNFGDMDRAMDLVNMGDADPLRIKLYKADERRQFREEIVMALDMYKKYLAGENHRHLPLRSPKCLRNFHDLLLPSGPFFFEWGARVGRHPGLTPQQKGEVAEALVQGWFRLNPESGPPTSLGYARALAGIESSIPGGRSALEKSLSSRVQRQLKAGALRQNMAESDSVFEKRWVQRGQVSASVKKGLLENRRRILAPR